MDFVWHETEDFHILTGKGSDWCPRVYVELITELFQQGITRCLVGTRGLLGEGWDANKINVLIDLTCVTTSMTINQLRGRSFRLDPDVPEKLANNWDVVCIAPEFKKGLDDYHRFRKKHKHLFGVTDDGCIEKGVGHVHAAFTEIEPEGVEKNMVELNQDMLERVGQRSHFRSLWKIGEPYHPEPIQTVEKSGRGMGFKALSLLARNGPKVPHPIDRLRGDWRSAESGVNGHHELARGRTGHPGCRTRGVMCAFFSRTPTRPPVACSLRPWPMYSGR